MRPLVLMFNVVMLAVVTLAGTAHAARPTVVAMQQDPDLQPGFPVKTFRDGGSYHRGPAIHTLVGNIDADPSLEIVTSALAAGPLYAWNADGTPVNGWPLSTDLGVGYPGLGKLANTASGMQVFAGYVASGNNNLVAYATNGAPLPGWPRTSGNYVSTPPALADVDGDGLDEIFIGEEDGLLHGYRADGSLLSGWPRGFVPGLPDQGGQRRQTPAIADLDGDGDLEIVTTSSGNSPDYLYAYHHTGADVAGFPVVQPGVGLADPMPVVGDVDGDGAAEIVLLGRTGQYDEEPETVYIFSAQGALERSIPLQGSTVYGTAPALADLNGDGVPEIVVQTGTTLEVWRGTGAALPGWPVVWKTSTFDYAGNSSPVVGDVDGDQSPDIVITNIPLSAYDQGEVRVYNRNGQLHPRFPKSLPIGDGAMPAIADLDLDGRNEIIVTGHYDDSEILVPGEYDTVWVYDLGGSAHGRVEWGQFGGGPRHHGSYGRTGGGSAPTNLLTNAGFELDANGDSRPDSWSSTSRFTRSNTVVHGGSYAGKHAATDNSSYTVSQTVPNLTAGSAYNFSGWVNIPSTSDTFSFKLYIAWKDSSGTTISYTTLKTYTGATGWNNARASLVAPAGTTQARVRMEASSLNATIYVDDFVFKPTVNSLTNAGFELDANGDSRPDSWSSTSRFTRSNTVVHGGSYAGKHAATDNSSYTVSQTVPNLTAGSAYNFSGWVNIPSTSDTFSFKLYIAWKDSSGTTISYTTLKTYTGATGWNNARASLVAPAGTTQAQVRMEASSLNATIYVDDFVFGP